VSAPRPSTIVDVVEPVPENCRAYDAYYPVYRSLYPALKPAFDAIAEIT
jgi:sugar (pentulose or hexulose) kinase